RSPHCSASWPATARVSSPDRRSWPTADWTPADMAEVFLPGADGTLTATRLAEPAALETASTPPTSRAVYAAAHVVADPLRACVPAGLDQIDWDATLELRRRLWS